jgi:hypothetical protein
MSIISALAQSVIEHNHSDDSTYTNTNNITPTPTRIRVLTTSIFQPRECILIPNKQNWRRRARENAVIAWIARREQAVDDVAAVIVDVPAGYSAALESAFWNGIADGVVEAGTNGCDETEEGGSG